MFMYIIFSVYNDFKPKNKLLSLIMEGVNGVDPTWGYVTLRLTHLRENKCLFCEKLCFGCCFHQ